MSLGSTPRNATQLLDDLSDCIDDALGMLRFIPENHNKYGPVQRALQKRLIEAQVMVDELIDRYR